MAQRKHGRAQTGDRVTDELADALDIDKLASVVLKLGQAMDTILNQPGGLTLDAVALLLQDQTGVGRTSIKTILKALPELHRHYCRPT